MTSVNLGNIGVPISLPGNTWKRASTLYTGEGIMRFYGQVKDSLTYKMRRPIVINLTATFGAGNEPTVEQMDEIMSKFPNSWFDGTKNLFRAKEALTKQIAIDARTEFDVKNGIINGNFSNGTIGWSASATLTPLGNGKVNLAPTGVSAYVEPSNLTTIPAKNGNKIYMSSYIKSSPDATNEKLMISGGITQVLLVNNGQLMHTSGALVSAIATLSGQTDGRMITAYVSNAFASAEIAGSSSYSFGYVTLIDLTTTFGAGKEPTLAEMDRLMARYPNSWFDSTKPIQTIETLYQEKANKAQEAWITPTLLNAWVGYASGFSACGYMKDSLGFVHLKGRLKSGILYSPVFVLPAGYRPKETCFFAVESNIAYGTAYVETNGQVWARNGNNASFSFDGITFMAEA